MKKLTLILSMLFLLSFYGTDTIYGKASWYGDKFHGRKTASGQVYNMYDFTAAAAPTIKMNSILKVTNEANGKSVEVLVNDRGSFHTAKYGHRLLDLSRAAFKSIANLDKGVIRVKVEIIRDGNNIRSSGRPL